MEIPPSVLAAHRARQAATSPPEAEPCEFAPECKAIVRYVNGWEWVHDCGHVKGTVEPCCYGCPAFDEGENA